MLTSGLLQVRYRIQDYVHDGECRLAVSDGSCSDSLLVSTSGLWLVCYRSQSCVSDGGAAHHTREGCAGQDDLKRQVQKQSMLLDAMYIVDVYSGPAALRGGCGWLISVLASGSLQSATLMPLTRNRAPSVHVARPEAVCASVSCCSATRD